MPSYPGDHQRVRRTLVAALAVRPGQPCARCGGPLLPGQRVDLDHLTPRAGGGQGPRALSHASCNRSHGGRLGNAAKAARRRRVMGPGTRISLGIEIYADRSRTAIVAAHIPTPGIADIELLPLVEGTDAVPAVTQMGEVFELAAVAVDPKSNAATLVAPLRQAGLRLQCPDAAALAVAHGTFTDLMNAGRLRHHNQAALNVAMRYAVQRSLAGAWAVQRYGNRTDPAPAVAAELAVWALGDLDHPQGAEPGAWAI